ncbi:hypothetical protein BDQ94DRAFT_150118 [Aspergillus welwitschiae]|uniref:Uncharacterized protein n=1 Tax=Aspergillus welwitschiae TaxID=1341132 RepID=A0A3F3PRQ8_9EURO|nr:hypothetical protein BDQ94DRAFT_150118 [Aspergillus welwitschiae]RDH29625.1 hypothetical protein BDQ94DRAFT_150118 [Aspergillus welwitschiae]
MPAGGCSRCTGITFLRGFRWVDVSFKLVWRLSTKALATIYYSTWMDHAEPGSEDARTGNQASPERELRTRSRLGLYAWRSSRTQRVSSLQLPLTD